MSNYTIVTNFLSKDALVSGNALKAVKGADFTTEFTAVQTAVNSKFDGVAQFAPDGSVSQPSFGFTNNNGTGMYNVAGVLNFATNQLQRISVSVAGNVTVNAPASGTTLTLNNAAGVVMLSATDTVQTAQIYTTAGNVWMGASSAHQLNLLTNNVARLAITSTGAVTINAPTSGLTMTVNGVTGGGSYAATFNGGTTAGDRGVVINGGTGAADYAFIVRNASAANNLMLVSGAGNVTLAPTSGVALNVSGVSGTHSTKISDSATNLFNAGYLEVPNNSQSVDYQLVLADSGKMIVNNKSGSAQVLTIPPNSTVAYPVGATITLYNNVGGQNITVTRGASVAMVLAGDTTFTNQNRTIAPGGMATITQYQAVNNWVISGIGIT